MSYKVYRVAYQGVPRDHHVLFIDINTPDGGGILIHVKGDIQNGQAIDITR